MCKYVPVHNNEPFPILCCDDQMSVKNMVSARLVMSARETEDFAHMKGLEPTPQEWHEQDLEDQKDERTLTHNFFTLLKK